MGQPPEDSFTFTKVLSYGQIDLWINLESGKRKRESVLQMLITLIKS